MAHSTTKKIDLHEYKARPLVPPDFQDAGTKVKGAKTHRSKTMPDSDTEEDEDVPSIETMIAFIDAQKTMQHENNSPGQLL